MSGQFFFQCETDIATRTDRGCVQRTTRSRFASQGALDKLDTTGHSTTLRLVFDTAALRRRSPTPSAWWTAITKTPAIPAIYPGHTRGILLSQNRLVALRHFDKAIHPMRGDLILLLSHRSNVNYNVESKDVTPI
jgi:hypothetical protein